MMKHKLPAIQFNGAPSASRGFTLLELALALIVMGALVTIGIRNSLADLDRELVSKTATDLQMIGEAGQAYITANSGPSGTLYTMAGNTATLTTANLQAAGSCGTSPCLTSTVTFTPPGTAAGNAYIVRVNRSGTAPNFTFTSVALTSRPWISGGITRLDLAGASARRIGAQGLVSYTTTTMDQSGSSGTGAAAATSAAYPEIYAIGQVGYMVSGGTASVNDNIYVRRDGLYAMTGELKLGGNNITGANAVNAVSATTTGALNAGSVTTAGTVSAGSVSSTGAIAGNTLAATTSVTAATATVNGALNANGNVTVASGNDIVLNSLGGSNKNLSARVPTTVPMQQSLFTLATANGWNTTVAKPSCSSGGTAQIQVTNNVAVGIVDSGRWGLQVQTSDIGASWTLRALRPNLTAPPAGSPDTVSGIAITYCAY